MMPSTQVPLKALSLGEHIPQDSFPSQPQDIHSGVVPNATIVHGYSFYDVTPRTVSMAEETYDDVTSRTVSMAEATCDDVPTEHHFFLDSFTSYTPYHSPSWTLSKAPGDCEDVLAEHQPLHSSFPFPLQDAVPAQTGPRTPSIRDDSWSKCQSPQDLTDVLLDTTGSSSPSAEVPGCRGFEELSTVQDAYEVPQKLQVRQRGENRKEAVVSSNGPESRLLSSNALDDDDVLTVDVLVFPTFEENQSQYPQQSDAALDSLTAGEFDDGGDDEDELAQFFTFPTYNALPEWCAA
ncbi:uncharacterized protein BKCO1_200079 [Diplodia corticola]|uniref:Uncharacterized protein n=1 Tax=Diplodia corticola TaxID=236234 RepID=A0A1J9RHU9_9PEZI|nr:uncharacterized protein BKCO1_200079 [Diplodia corticola]OJD40009.1 hypothetical protein BKCO1_200079 [Diplodia corticola]